MSIVKFFAVVSTVAVVSFGCATSAPTSSAGKYTYDADAQSLTVNFSEGSTYVYAGVPSDVYDQIMSAESQGKAFNQLVRGKYEATKVE